MKENKLRLFGHVIKTDEAEAVQFVMKLNLEGKEED